MISWSNRGQGSCPNCATVYFNRSKPVECSNCGYHLGGSAAAKMPKLSCPVADHIHGGLYSLRTSTRDDRCFVYKECDNWICLHSKCKDIRAMYVSSNRTDEFSCQHLKHFSHRRQNIFLPVRFCFKRNAEERGCPRRSSGCV